jgi:hypothetical protein
MMRSQKAAGTTGRGFKKVKGKRSTPGATNLRTRSCQPLRSANSFLVSASAEARLKAQRILIGNQSRKRGSIVTETTLYEVRNYYSLDFSNNTIPSR